MAEKEPKVQQTRPKQGEPATIPVPKREDFLRDLSKVAPPIERSADPNDDESPS